MCYLPGWWQLFPQSDTTLMFEKLDEMTLTMTCVFVESENVINAEAVGSCSGSNLSRFIADHICPCLLSTMSGCLVIWAMAPPPLPPPTPLKVFGQNDPNEREGGGQWPKDISDPDVLLSKTFKILRGKTILYLLWCDPPRSFPRPTKLCSHYTHCKYFVSNIGVSFLFHFVKLLWALTTTANIFSHLFKCSPGFFLNLWEPNIYRLKVLICRNGKLCSNNIKEDL